MRTLAVLLNDDRVGTLHESNDLWSFEYDEQWAKGPDAFDLSPALSRATVRHEDGASDRPVQWYFDNLLPEEQLRQAVSKDAKLDAEDAFALLQYLGAESAGSLVLQSPDAPARAREGLKPLPNEELSQRIRNLPRMTLSHGAPKRMSVAGAQEKLLVVLRDGALFEPRGAEPSTHILKPNHVADDYPATVINEYLVMRLAAERGLRVPDVFRRYVPEPVYIVKRFDRFMDGSGATQRLHIIDACQLLNKARTFKYAAATLQTLTQLVGQCRNRASTRLRLYQWLVFNVLVGNHDNHLKNLSFMVGKEGIELAPAYDLLGTAAYHTRAFAGDRADWPRVEMAIALPDAPTFDSVTRTAVLAAGRALGLSTGISSRELDRMARGLAPALDHLIEEFEQQSAELSEEARRFLGAERHLTGTLRHVVVPEMLGRIAHE